MGTLVDVLFGAVSASILIFLGQALRDASRRARAARENLERMRRENEEREATHRAEAAERKGAATEANREREASRRHGELAQGLREISQLMEQARARPQMPSEMQRLAAEVKAAMAAVDASNRKMTEVLQRQEARATAVQGVELFAEALPAHGPQTETERIVLTAWAARIAKWAESPAEAGFDMAEEFPAVLDAFRSRSSLRSSSSESCSSSGVPLRPGSQPAPEEGTR